MNNRYTHLLGIALALCLPFLIQAQTTFKAKEIKVSHRASELSSKFLNYTIYQFHPQALRSVLDNPDADYFINLEFCENVQWQADLVPFDLYHPDAIIRVMTENGEEVYPVSRNVTFKGSVSGSHQGGLRIHANGDYFRAYVDNGTDRYYFSPLTNFLDNARSDYYVLYKESESIVNEIGSCGNEGFAEEHHEDHDHESRSAIGECFEATMGIAHDYQMYVAQGGSVQNCENHAIDVMMDVATNYDYAGVGVNFNDGLTFNILEQFVSTCSTCDPWTSSADASALLNDFRTWGLSAGGFQNDVNFGQLWTDRNITFNGNASTVGLASTATGLMCNDRAYHVLENYTTDEESLRILTAHEMGHNLGLQHDATNGFIMSPSVNPTTVWSAGSRANGSIEIANAGSNCLIPCFTASFTADQCVAWGNATVSFTDISAGSTSWLWNFGDGTTSTQENPTHTYNAPGNYTVSLVINGGESMVERNSFITVLPERSLPYTLSDGGNMENNDFLASALSCSDENIIWDKGVPSGAPYFTAPAGDVAWVTNLQGDVIKETAQSYIYSPRFNFNIPGTYNLNFELGCESYYANAPFAAQLQYSLDNGTTWIRLGDETDANWYNRGPTKQFEISNVIFDDRTGWLFTSQANNYRYDISFLNGNSSVAFRLAYSVSGLFNNSIGYNVDGFKFDNFTIDFEADVATPVELTLFDGKPIDRAVMLYWQTESELNNDFFLIEKSVDGRTFEAIGNVSGSGTTFDASNYELMDYNPAKGVNYYRLTQFDYDGSYEIMQNIVAVTFDQENGISVQPNPVKGDWLQLNYSAGNGQDEINVRIYNTAGHLVKDFLFAGASSQISFDLSLDELSAGLYLLQVQQGNATSSLRFVKSE